MTTACPLCTPQDEVVLWRDATLRVILAMDRDYPAFCRVILNRHVREMTDLPCDERARVMQAVFAVETALRDLLRPDKINLASLGNQVPHLHWHIIPRFADDRHFPDPVWSAPKRADATAQGVEVSVLVAMLEQRLQEECATPHA
jgi:diadenosine tetraphosphate (Ap4A) HIT family hydrolase